MILEEWKSTHLEGAVQYDKSISWFKDHVKCCYNCSNWYRDPMLMGEYTYNCCIAHEGHMTVYHLPYLKKEVGLMLGYFKKKTILDESKKKRKKAKISDFMFYS